MARGNKGMTLTLQPITTEILVDVIKGLLSGEYSREEAKLVAQPDKEHPENVPDIFQDTLHPWR
jgi:hypothetical protein